jgi:hypothetical protein
MTLLGFRVRPQRWPWQKGGRRQDITGWQRFGGGWKYKFGVDVGGTSIIINLIWGMIRIDRVKGA